MERHARPSYVEILRGDYESPVAHSLDDVHDWLTRPPRPAPTLTQRARRRILELDRRVRAAWAIVRTGEVPY